MNHDATFAINKRQAICALRIKGFTVGETATFSSKNSTVNCYWANPKVEFLRKDWSIILNDSVKRTLHLFFVPAYKIDESELSLRKDNNRIRLEFNYNDVFFTDSKSGVSFKPFYIGSVQY